MPYYKGETVSDTFLQGLCSAYRAGLTSAGAEHAEGGDASVIARLESQNAEQVGAAALGLLDGGASDPSVADAIDVMATLDTGDAASHASAEK